MRDVGVGSADATMRAEHAQVNYYRRYVGDYLRDTARLSMLEHGAYNLLLDYYYADEKPLPLDRDEIYTMVRAMGSADRKAVDKILRTFFTEADDGYHQKRVDHEILVSQKARDNGKGGGRPPKEIETGSVTGTVTGKQAGTEPEWKPDAKPLTQTGLVTAQGGGSGHPPTTNHQPPASNPHPPPGTDGAAAPPARAKRADSKDEKQPAKSNAAWNRYREAYRERYRTEPVENAKVRSQLCQLVDRVGVEAAPEVAAFYVRHNGAWYVKNMHQIEWLVRDCEKLHTEWVTGATMTDTKARQTDRTAANAGVWGGLIAEAEARERTVDEH